MHKTQIKNVRHFASNVNYLLRLTLDHVFDKRTMSVGSVQSATSGTEDAVADDETTVEVQRKKFFRQPFIFKILKLNMPEISWIILGCISSMAFGCLTPVSFFSEKSR